MEAAVRQKLTHITDAGGCSELQPSHLVASARGFDLRVEEVRYGGLPRLKVVVLDTSSSLGMEYVQRVGSEIARYVDSLGPNEFISVLAFDQDLRLIAAPGPATRPILRSVLTEMPPGAGTAYRDSLSEVALLFRDEPFDVDVFLVSDGRDLHSGHTREHVALLERLGAAANMTIHAIIPLQAMDEPGYGRSPRWPGLHFLRSGDQAVVPSNIRDLWAISRATGGEAVVAQADLVAALRAASHRIEHKVEVVLAVTASRDQDESPLPLLKLRARKPSPCTLTLLPPTAEKQDERRSVVQPRTNTRRRRDSDKMERPLSMTFPVPVSERGIGFDRAAYRRCGVYRARRFHEDVRKSREVTFLIPPLTTVRQRLHHPVDVLEWLAETAPSVFRGHQLDTWSFIENRRVIAQRVTREFEDLGHWVRRRVDTERNARLAKELASISPLGHALPSAVITQLDREISDVFRETESAYVATLLGERGALEIAKAIERRAVDSLLRRPYTEMAGRIAQSTTFRTWNLLFDLVAPGAVPRVIVLPILAYDPSRDVFGFWQISRQRPWPLEAGMEPVDLVPEEPLATRTVLAYFSEEAEGHLPRGFRVSTIDYEYAAREQDVLCSVEDRREPAVFRSESAEVLVRIRLVSGGTGGGDLELAGRWRRTWSDGAAKFEFLNYATTATVPRMRTDTPTR